MTDVLEGVADQLQRHEEHLLEELAQCRSMRDQYRPMPAGGYAIPDVQLRTPDCDELVWLAQRADRSGVRMFLHRNGTHEVQYFAFPAGVINLDAVELCPTCFSRSDGGPMSFDEGARRLMGLDEGLL